MVGAPKSSPRRGRSPSRLRPGASRSRRSTKTSSPAICSPRTCLTPICWSAPAASSASAISSYGNAPTPSWSSPRRCGRILGAAISIRRSPIIAAASAATVPRLARAEREYQGSRGSLGLRTLSALVLAPIAIAIVWFGWPWLPIVTAMAGAVMAWEWARLCHAGRLRASGVVLIGAVLGAVAAAAAAEITLAIAVSLAGAAAVFGMARREPEGAAQWLALGELWVALPCVLLLWLARMEDGTGRVTVLWIFAVVWSTDIGGSAIGRRLGGPRLAPRWSPGKTWAGLIGGAGCAALAGWGTARALGISAVLPLVLVSAGLAI